MKILKAIVATLGMTACFFFLGCGSAVVESLGAPSISAVLPQTIAAGSSTVTMKVVGTNFTNNAVILWNGGKLATTVIDATTVSGSIQGGSLAVPGTAQVQVQNSQTGQASQAVPIAIVSSGTNVSLPLAISTSSLTPGVVGTAYSANLVANGGTSPYTWSITSGSLPAGLSLAAGSGVITGTPTASGTFSFTATVSDSSNPVQTQSAAVSITVTPPVLVPTLLSLSPSTLLSGTVGTAYAQTLQAGGGTPAYAWSITSGSLPAGLSLAAGSGVISGTPTASGTSSFTVTVSDSSNPVQTKSASMSITVSAASTKLAILSSALAAGTEGAAYAQTLQASGGTSPYTWSITSGSLPEGLSLAAGSGAITGTPTANGTFSFTVTVSDRSNPVQTKSASMSITVAATQLAIISSALAAGTQGTAYSQTLHASGGTPSYAWSITSGSLPAGLSLAAGSGAITGTPTASGTFNFTVTVSDSGNPVQTKSLASSITVAGTQLAIATSALPSGTDGTAYSQTLQATGGTPSYTWSITSGSLPSGLTLAAGMISGTPTASGTFNFTVMVTDSGNPAKTKSLATSITVVAAASAPTGPGTTWYIRSDGGTRYSTNITNGQCNGKADAAYPGTGVNQPCAFNDVRMLWQDGSYSYGDTFPGWGWVIAGGDTVIIRGSIGTGVSYRIGNQNNGTPWCTAADNSSGCWGIPGNQFQGAPPPPSGTSSQHTRILGENYASCTTQNVRTQLHGGWGVDFTLDLTGASYVDLACLDITDFSNCGRDTDTIPCETNGDVIADFADDGIRLYSTSTHITLTDVRIHGLASDGISGAPGTGFVANDLYILGNADAGWNADPGDGTTGVGTLNVTNFNISWNGCVEEYPIVDPLPYFSCTDDSSGGYGDGFGTTTVPSPSPGWQVHFDQGIVSYNTQDGLDALHVSGTGSTMTDTRVLAYGNQGQQLKVGDGAVATIQNSVIVGNCEALTTQAIPGTPAGFGSLLQDPCRAGNTAVIVETIPGYPATFQNNTIYDAGAIGLEVEYATSNFGNTNVLKYNNNIFIGFYNADSGSNASVMYSNGGPGGIGGTSALPAVLTNPGASWTNNSTFDQRVNWSCPAAGESAALCTDPGLADETYHPYGYGNMAPASPASAVVGAGVAIPGITVDYTGQTRPNPPSMGAYEPLP